MSSKKKMTIVLIVAIIVVAGITGWIFRDQLGNMFAKKQGTQAPIQVVQKDEPLMLQIEEVADDHLTAKMQPRPSQLGSQYQDSRTVKVLTNKDTVYINVDTNKGVIEKEEIGSRNDLKKGYYIITDSTTVDIGSVSIAPGVIRYAKEKVY